jgi:hypothetical protein
MLFHPAWNTGPAFHPAWNNTGPAFHPAGNTAAAFHHAQNSTLLELLALLSIFLKMLACLTFAAFTDGIHCWEFHPAGNTGAAFYPAGNICSVFTSCWNLAFLSNPARRVLLLSLHSAGKTSPAF